tara:strand:- start:407 stop:808 length:402 start_codon:yes stop_codon:yes gene_type:complete
MKNIDRIERLEEELALLKAGIKAGQEPIQEPILCSNPEMLFEVYPIHFRKTNWEDAMKACADLRDGWRLPTRLELLIMYNNQDEIGGFAANYYWSSTEYVNGYAWWQGFGNGNQDVNNKFGNGYVRAVRDIKK